MEKGDYKQLLDMAVLAGEVMLRSGAETYRVEDTMDRILQTSELEKIEAFALMTGIVVTLDGAQLEHPLTVMKRVSDRSTNLNNLIKANDISRKYCEGKLTLSEAYEKLQKVKEKQYSRTIYNLATVGVAAGFAIMFGGSTLDVAIATIVGLLLATVTTLGKVFKIHSILVDILSGISIAVLTIAFKTFVFLQIDMDIIIVSAIMPMVPGVAITNAIRDTLHGDYLSGSARVLEAFLKAASIALGVGVGMALFGMMMGRSVL